LRAQFELREREAAEEERHNPFSAKFDGGKATLRPGDAGYGTAKRGSLTEARAQKAQAWVEVEISRLFAVISEHGDTRQDGQVVITFGKLFWVYADISDTLVGILMRARRRGELSFDGEMLFQGMHDHVEIVIPSPAGLCGRDSRK